ncbi:Hypothetical predicted protein [Paramuricea clavata]|uniref:Uncharacterized protein n=1 Tax=Paramuricea clavata TaxID=317549 RepID=A0A6S7ICQ1_PARCT|nr:Hypothetical predicted protein [Paramuricea clavata]
MVLTSCEVVLVNRNVKDSFRVGKDGCTNDASVCTSSATCQSDGSCLCSGSKPNFSNPNIIVGGGRLEYGDSYGCVSSEYLRFGVGSLNHCVFAPFQLIPPSHQDPATKFSDIDNPRALFRNCSLKKALAKFLSNTTETKLQWLNNSYVDLTVFNATLEFKWKRSVPSLRGTIITLHLVCDLRPSNIFVPKCLRAKVLGTWQADAVSVPTSPTVLTSSQPKSSQITTKATSSVTVTTAESSMFYK